MQFIPPRDTARIKWTQHVVRKMRYYGLSPMRVLRVFNRPEREEQGVAPGTVARMSAVSPKRTASGRKTWKSEIWMMYQPLRGQAIRIITAWRYPGMSPIREAVPIPPDVLAELEAEGLLDANE